MIDEKKLLNEMIDLLAKHCKDMELAGKIVGLIDIQPTIQPQGIDKDRLIGELVKLKNGLNTVNLSPSVSLDYVIKIINQQPTTDGWIPVSERLPEEDGKYLCTTRHGEVHILRFSNDLYSADKHFFEHYKGKNKKGFHKDWRIEITNLKA